MKNYQIYYNELQSETKIDIPLRTYALTFLSNRVKKIEEEKRELFEGTLKIAQEKWSNLINYYPYFFIGKVINI